MFFGGESFADRKSRHKMVRKYRRRNALYFMAYVGREQKKHESIAKRRGKKDVNRFESVFISRSARDITFSAPTSDNTDDQITVFQSHQSQRINA